MADVAKLNEAEALLSKLERRVAMLEAKRLVVETPVVAAGPAASEELIEENNELKAKVQKLEYRILILSNALRDADLRSNLGPTDMV